MSDTGSATSAILAAHFAPDMHTPESDLPPDLHELVEILAENTYNIRARQRIANSESSSDGAAAGFPPYEELADAAKQDHRNLAMETLKLVRSLGYKLDAPRLPLVTAAGKKTAASESAALAQIDSLNLPAAIALWQSRVPDEWSETPEMYRRLARRVLKLAEPLLAYDILSEALKETPKDVEFRQQLALALARSGATQRANSILTQLRDEGHRDEETLGILARSHKDLWMHATTRSEANRQLKLAHKFYHEAYKLNRGYYSGINAATLALLIGKEDEASTLARNVRQACVTELKTLPKDSPYRYWPLATLGEASLISRRWSEAEEWYAQAAAVAKGQFADLSSTRRNARLLLNHFRRDSTVIERALKIPGIVVFAGHLIDQPNRATPRFPADLEPAVREAIKSRITKIAPGFGYASAGCGADILFFESLLERGAEAHVVLPYDKEQFIKDSVAFANAGWLTRFERVLERATTVTIASSERIEEGSMSFEYANLLLFGLADIRARQLETDLLPLAVWDQKPGDGPGGTASAVEHWKNLGLEVQVIDLEKIRKSQSGRRGADQPRGSSPTVREGSNATKPSIQKS
ncbi:MAG TPA: TRAFs-binding domain-containing protein, partial [Pyrinomonadaceae bacterium]|nr:TRAFs-binding domain-containing protein [Pyrinomonadaceae bacterium]